ncbi:MAG: hypothetical protein K5705_01945 [Oscillospiraceae bacterium]|nr:hypothetical protein [Oscillospiraceae bacterium]MCR4759031.1 hypothetical protein [Oscillospiraceae bacterium]
MKQVIKKITAIALAFTLIGAETAITKTIAPQADNSITAHAATCNNCHSGSLYVMTYEVTEHVQKAFPSESFPLFYTSIAYTYKIEECYHCNTVISKKLIRVS